jgi:hypothetical protein
LPHTNIGLPHTNIAKPHTNIARETTIFQQIDKVWGQPGWSLFAKSEVPPVGVVNTSAEARRSPPCLSPGVILLVAAGTAIFC